MFEVHRSASAIILAHGVQALGIAVGQDIVAISLGIWIAGNTEPMVQPGHAVLVDGTWKVSKTTFCTLVELGNNEKPVAGCGARFHQGAMPELSARPWLS